MKILKKFLKFFTGRLFFFALSIILQFSLIILMILHISTYGYLFYAFMAILSMTTVLFIVAKKDNPMYKLAWIIPITFFPVFGWFIYFIGGRAKVSKRRRKHINNIVEQTNPLLIQNQNIIDEIEHDDKSFLKLVTYLNTTSNFPIYKNTTIQYLTPGESFFESLCEELKKAKNFIFMEYFIIDNGIMWDTILEILKRKASEGVEVRIMYDGMCSIALLP
ncbi:MAG: PLDc N-terminal domain-containing protein, partial [Oscillospiraceae bacterium]